MTNSTALPKVMSDPGFLFRAPLGTTEPTNTVVGSVFTDAWPAGWVSVGATEDGSEFNYEVKIEAITVAEFLDPIKYATTERSGSLAFNMADYTLTKWSWALNGGTLAVVSGTGTTQLNSLTPPAPGTEVRCMLGWESLDATVRLVMYQCVNGTAIKSENKKAPNISTITTEFNFELPSNGIPWKLYSAGTARA